MKTLFTIFQPKQCLISCFLAESFDLSKLSNQIPFLQYLQENEYFNLEIKLYLAKIIHPIIQSSEE
jgi:hypothetical protein